MSARWAVRDFDAWPKRVLFPIVAFAVDGVSLAAGLVGLWVATSVAVYFNLSILWAMAAGLAVFPGVPLVLEAWHRYDRRRYGETDADHPPSRVRMLRTSLWVNAALVVIALVVFPRVVFTAITTRGDWMFEHLDATWGRSLLAFADNADFLVTEDNPYADYDDSKTVAPNSAGWKDEPLFTTPPAGGQPDAGRAPSTDPVKSERDAGTVFERPRPAGSGRDAGAVFERRRPAGSARDAGKTDTDPAVSPNAGASTGLEILRPGADVVTAPPSPPPSSGATIIRDPVYGVPMLVMTGTPEPASPKPPPAPAEGGYTAQLRAAQPHALANNIPASEAASYTTVAQYIANRVRDPFERIKAIHDFIALRIAYDADFDLGQLPPSDPQVVFERREAVCAGYARLFKAMVEATGGHAVYISGEARFAQPRNPSASHAWNAVEIAGGWYLVDVTWNAGHLDGRRFVKKYRTDYLFAPPEVFVFTHFPSDDRWQLLETPRTRGELLRQPLLLPRFFAYGLGIISPNRAQISTTGHADFAVTNPRLESVFFSVASQARPTGPFDECAATAKTPNEAAARCRFTANDSYYVYVFAAPAGQSKHEAVARFEVNNTPG